MGLDPSTMPDWMKRKLPASEKKRLGAVGMTMDELISWQTIRSERQLQNQIADYLRLRGIPFYRSRMDKRTTNKKGQPDFLCCVPPPCCTWSAECKPKGIFLAMEAKMPGKEPTPEQWQELQKIQDAGGIALVVYSLNAVKSVLDDLQPKASEP